MNKTLIKYFGGMSYHAQWIISHFPERYEQLPYVELYGGGASVALRKKQSLVATTYNEINPGLYLLWSVVKHNHKELQDRLSKEKYSAEVFEAAKIYCEENNRFDEYTNILELASQTYIKYRMSRGGQGKTFAWSNRFRNGKPGDINAWLNSLENISTIAKLCKDWNIINKDALWIFKYSLTNTKQNILIYLDPPFMKSSRVAKNVYDYEVEENHHAELLETIDNLPSQTKIVLSGYMTDLYKSKLKNWNLHQKEVVNNSGQTKRKSKRTNCLWTNY